MDEPNEVLPKFNLEINAIDWLLMVQNVGPNEMHNFQHTFSVHIDIWVSVVDLHIYSTAHTGKFPTRL